jgi:fibronectin-binding autotransporter adhesin
LSYVNVDVKGYQESGGPAALRSDGGSVGSTFSMLGLHSSTNLSDRARLRGTLGWRRHAFGDNVPTSTNAFGTGSSFTVAGVPLAQNVAVIEVGVEAQLGLDMTLVASYASQFGSGQKDQQFASLLLRWR